MKRYVYVFDPPKKRGRMNGRVFRVKNDLLVYVTDFSYSTGCCKGATSEVYNALMECGEIPKKWYRSSECEWRGPGYYGGEVCAHYDIQGI